VRSVTGGAVIDTHISHGSSRAGRFGPCEEAHGKMG
jgi:hypothetical protein